MKEFKATFIKTVYYNGGMKQVVVDRMVEATNIKSARSKAKKIEQYGAKVRTCYLLQNVEEAIEI